MLQPAIQEGQLQPPVLQPCTQAVSTLQPSTQEGQANRNVAKRLRSMLQRGCLLQPQHSNPCATAATAAAHPSLGSNAKAAVRLRQQLLQQRPSGPATGPATGSAAGPVSVPVSGPVGGPMSLLASCSEPDLDLASDPELRPVGCPASHQVASELRDSLLLGPGGLGLSSTVPAAADPDLVNGTLSHAAVASAVDVADLVHGNSYPAAAAAVAAAVDLAPGASSRAGACLPGPSHATGSGSVVSDPPQQASAPECGGEAVAMAVAAPDYGGEAVAAAAVVAVAAAVAAIPRPRRPLASSLTLEELASPSLSTPSLPDILLDLQRHLGQAPTHTHTSHMPSHVHAAATVSEHEPPPPACLLQPPPACLLQPQAEQTAVVFLGTGCAEPSKVCRGGVGF